MTESFKELFGRKLRDLFLAGHISMDRVEILSTAVFKHFEGKDEDTTVIADFIRKYCKDDPSVYLEFAEYVRKDDELLQSEIISKLRATSDE